MARGVNVIEIGKTFEAHVGSKTPRQEEYDRLMRPHLIAILNTTIKNIGEAKRDPEAWAATQKEMHQVLTVMKCWHLVPPCEVPPNTPVFTPIWNWTRRFDGSVKARICFPGHRQKQGRDYGETESPTLHMATFRLFMTFAQLWGGETCHIDVKSAYLHGKMDKDLYMKQPPGFVDPEKPDWVCKIDQALYGAKQAGRLWNVEANDVLISFGLVRHTHDACLYYRVISRDNWIIVMLFVDDYAVIGMKANIEALIVLLDKKFEIKVLGPIKRFIGINVTTLPNGSFTLDQKEDIKEALQKFKMSGCKAAPNPGTIDMSSAEMKEGEPMDQTLYRSAIGTLFWLALCTVPSILFAVTVCAQFQSAPTTTCWKAVKRVFRYLKLVENQPLVMDIGPNPTLESFSDSSHGDPIVTRSSVSGGIHFLGNAPILWTSRKQKTPAHSSAEAELVSASSVGRDAMWLSHLLRPFGFTDPTVLNIDNQATIHISESFGLIRRVKHLEIQDLYLRVLTNTKKVKVVYCPTERNLADMLTKAIQSTLQFTKLANLVMLGLKDRD
jgi:hypothetical protein